MVVSERTGASVLGLKGPGPAAGASPTWMGGAVYLATAM